MMKRFAMLAALLSAFLLLPVSPCPGQTDDETPSSPLWEIGLFTGAARVPHYRGSDEYEWYVLPLPYLVYRGDIFQADREGVRGIFYKGDDFETDISLSGNPPVSDDNDARDGMAELDAVFEVGPALKWFPLGRDPMDTMYASLAVRAVNSLGFDDGIDLAYQGIHGELAWVYRNQRLLKDLGVTFRLKASLDYGDSDFNRYFYEVPERDARPGRPAYDASSGYAGCAASFSAQKRLTDRFSLGFYSRWQNVTGATFEDSPLVREKNNFTVGAALIWKMFESERRAPDRE